MPSFLENAKLLRLPCQSFYLGLVTHTWQPLSHRGKGRTRERHHLASSPASPADISIHDMLPRHVCRERPHRRTREEAKEDKKKAVQVAAHILADSLLDLLDLLGVLTLLLCNP